MNKDKLISMLESDDYDMLLLGCKILIGKLIEDIDYWKEIGKNIFTRLDNIVCSICKSNSVITYICSTHGRKYIFMHDNSENYLSRNSTKEELEEFLNILNQEYE